MDGKSMKLIAVTILSAVLCACAGLGHEARPDQPSDAMGTEPGFQLRMVQERGDVSPAPVCADPKQCASASLSYKDSDAAKVHDAEEQRHPKTHD